MTWIPVTERLPEDEVPVLAWNSVEKMCMEAWREVDHWESCACWRQDIPVTHWQPLPASPEPVLTEHEALELALGEAVRLLEHCGSDLERHHCTFSLHLLDALLPKPIAPLKKGE